MTPRADVRRPLELMRLWCSYQRYAFAIGGLPVALAIAVGWRWPSAWWAWGALAASTGVVGPWALDIYRRWPRKLRATRLAARRIAAGRFRAGMVQRYCGDPCSRVVAHEILRRAGVPARARRRQIARYAAIEAAKTRALVLGNASVTFVVDGDGVRRLERVGEGSR